MRRFYPLKPDAIRDKDPDVVRISVELKQGHPTVASALDVLSWPILHGQYT